jgi:hypothetical protein
VIQRAVLSLFALLFATTVAVPLALAQPSRPRRIAVVVGANDAAPGRVPLRYAHEDAKRIAEVLERVGRFAKRDVQVLLEPRAADVVLALERVEREVRAAGGDALFVFYYSGHSDGQSLFPRGEPLSLADLRERFARSSARVRVGILDTCRGGSWTRAKGLSLGPPLDPVDLLDVGAEGSALLSSSSGIENAHEADAVRGSFFTHHVAAGLLGAADRSGDGTVTLQEAFEYAKERTIRDSARLAVTPQHPSYEVQLRGRQDIVLAHVAASPSALVLRQTSSLEIIHLNTGVSVLETPPGRKQLRLALVPGRYLVRRVEVGRVFSKEVEVRAGQTTTLSDDELVLSGSAAVARKGDGEEELPSRSTSSTPARNWWELRLAAGPTTGARTIGDATYFQRGTDAVLAVTYGVNDRLAWTVPLPAFAYRFGTEGRFEVIPRLGLSAVGYATFSGFSGTLDGGVATRAWISPRLSVVSNASADQSFDQNAVVYLRSTNQRVATRSDSLQLRVSAGLVWELHRVVSLHAALGWAGSAVLRDADIPSVTTFDTPVARPTSAVTLGASQSLGYRPLPLVQVHLSRRFSLDAYAAWAFDLRGGPMSDRYLGGFSWAF